MIKVLLLTLVAVPAVALAQNTAKWEDQPVTAKERTSVITALRAIGCTNPTRIERDDDGYEADNAKCRDGVYDIDLDRRFRVIDRDREDDVRSR